MTARISSLGQYRGYTDVRFDDGQRTSCYVPMRDGVRLAVDIFRPSLDGAVVDEPLPTLWTHTRYHRASLTEDGEVLTTFEKWDDWLFRVIRHGYVAVTVDVRGGGASFGVYSGQYSADESRDAYDMTEWIAGQAWCNGNVAMFGASYLGITQFFAAAKAPPHLKAIFPEMASFDHYAYAYGGGVFRETSRFDWQSMVGNLDHAVPMVWRGEYNGPVAPVDGEDGGRLLGQALQEHRANLNWYRILTTRHTATASTRIAASTFIRAEVRATAWTPSSVPACRSITLPAGSTCFRATPCYGGGTSVIHRSWSSAPGFMMIGTNLISRPSTCAGTTTG